MASQDALVGLQRLNEHQLRKVLERLLNDTLLSAPQLIEEELANLGSENNAARATYTTSWLYANPGRLEVSMEPLLQTRCVQQITAKGMFPMCAITLGIISGLFGPLLSGQSAANQPVVTLAMVIIAQTYVVLWANRMPSFLFWRCFKTFDVAMIVGYGVAARMAVAYNTIITVSQGRQSSGQPSMKQCT